MKPHYSPYKKAQGFLFTSGQLPLLNRETKAVPKGIKEQSRLVFAKILEILGKEGLTKEAIVKTTAYITDINDWGAVNEIYAEFFGNHKPARSIIPVSKLHYGCLIELEAIAILNEVTRDNSDK